jgi:PilS N terminal
MPHDFLLKARSNPDLQDFCDYLTKPLQILEELEYRYKSLPLETKVKPINMMMHLKIDKILNQYLPNMVDNYCDFSFKYRNEHLIKTIKTKERDVSYTVKEVLLQNLAKLVEEIHVLEEDFNENNKFKLLVQEKILNHLGYATDLDDSPSKIVLENKFKYQDQEIFKKPVKELPKEVIKQLPQIPQAQTVNIEKKSFDSSRILEFCLVFGFIAVILTATFTMYGKVKVENQILAEVNNINVLQSGIKSLYTAKESYTGLNNKIISSARIVPDLMAYNDNVNNSFGGTVSVKASANSSQFDIVYEALPDTACKKLVQDVSAKFSKVMIGAYTIQDFKENIFLDPKKLSDVCSLSSTKKESIIFTSS